MKSMKTTELVAIYNALADTPIKAWKGKKTVLIEKIEAMKAEVFENGLDAETVSETETDNATYDVTEAVTEDAQVAEATGKAPTIREKAIELLCHVAYHENKMEKSGDENRVDAGDENARSVGIPYDQIIDGIMAAFPEAKTSVACLRWYAVKIRAEEFGYEGLRMCQRRPRVRK